MTKEEWDAYLTEIFPPEIQGVKRPEEPIPADLEFCARLLQLMREDPVDAVLINALLRQIMSNDCLLKQCTEQLTEQLENCATKAYTDAKVAGVVNAAPETLDTLQELASALGNDANFSTTITNLIGMKANISDVPTKGGMGASGTWGISIAGNAATATKLLAVRTINGIAFDGSANITITAAANGGTATNVSGGTANATTITASSGRIETTGTATNLPQVLWHIPGVNYSRLRMDTDGTIHLQNGGSDNYVGIKAANFIGHLTGSADSIGGVGSDQICISRGTASGDLNNLYTPGVYQVTPETNTNWPAGAYNYGILFVYAPHGSTYGGALSQMYISHRNGIYTRSGGWGTLNWTEWSQLIGCNLSGHLVLSSGSEIWVE